MGVGKIKRGCALITTMIVLFFLIKNNPQNDDQLSSTLIKDATLHDETLVCFQERKKSRRAGSSVISWRIDSLVKKTLRRHHAGFEPQRALSFVKGVEAL
jgi:hypothetical protein